MVRRRKNKSFFFRIFLSFLLSVVVLIVTLSIIISQSYASATQALIQKNALSSLHGISLTAANIGEELSSLAVQCAYDNTILGMLYYPVSPDNYINDIIRLKSYRDAYQNMESVYIYNGENFYVTFKNSQIYTRADFPDDGILQILDHYEQYATETIIPRYVDNAILNGGQGQSLVYTYIYPNSIQADGTVNNAIVFNISENSLKNNIQASNSSNTRVLIIDDKGSTVMNDPQYPALSDLSAQPFVTRILRDSAASGFFTAYVGDTRALVTYAAIPMNHWIYLSITPESVIQAPIRSMQWKTYLIGFVFLLLGASAIYFLSKHVTVPVTLMEKNINALTEEKRQNYLKNRYELMLGVIMNGVAANPHQLNEYSVTLDMDALFLPMLIRIDHYGAFCASNNLKDRAMIKFGIINIASELLSDHFVNEGVDIGADSVCMLLCKRNSVDRSILTVLLNGVISSIHTSLDISITITISEQAHGIESLREALGHLQETSEYRMIIGLGSVIWVEDICFAPSESFSYPYEDENTLTEALMLGQTEQAKYVLKKIVDYSTQFDRPILDACLLRMLIAVNNCYGVIQKNHTLSTLFRISDYQQYIHDAEVVEDILCPFNSLFETTSTDMNSEKRNRYERLITQVVSVVEHDYASPDLCLNKIADMVSMSPDYLSRLFRQHRSVSVSDYINSVRLEKAKDLIINHNTPVNSVIAMTGFVSRSHFYSLFKKAYSISPNTMRAQIVSQMEKHSPEL